MRRIVRFASVALLACTLVACQEELYRDVSQRDANEMVAILANNGISAARQTGENGSYRVTVPSGSFAPAVDVLRRAGYPRERYRSLAEVFPGDGLIVSPFEQRARMMYALNQEIARTLAGIEGVTSARVHIVVPELDLRGAPQSRASASVVIHHTATVEPDELAPKARQLVANAVQGLSYRDVSIAFFVSSPDLRGSAGEPAVRRAIPAPRDGLMLLVALLLAGVAAVLGWRSLRQKAG
jgi:type III secretion protein J